MSLMRRSLVYEFLSLRHVVTRFSVDRDQVRRILANELGVICRPQPQRSKRPHRGVIAQKRA